MDSNIERERSLSRAGSRAGSRGRDEIDLNAKAAGADFSMDLLSKKLTGKCSSQLHLQWPYISRGSVTNWWYIIAKCFTNWFLYFRGQIGAVEHCHRIRLEVETGIETWAWRRRAFAVSCRLKSSKPRWVPCSFCRANQEAGATKTGSNYEETWRYWPVWNFALYAWSACQATWRS